MKKQLRERLRSQSNALLTESIVYEQDQLKDTSLIHELGDLLDESPERGDLPSARRQVRKITQSASLLLLDRSKRTQNIRQSKVGESNSFRKTKNTIQTVKQNQFIREKPSKYDFRGVQSRKNTYMQHSKYAAEPPTQDIQTAKIKYQFNKSNIIKYKQLIQAHFLQQCSNCQMTKTQYNGHGFICGNSQCAVKQQQKIYPFVSLLYEMQNPSATPEQLQELIRATAEEIVRVQGLLNSLVELKNRLDGIAEQKKQHLKFNRNELKDIFLCVRKSEPGAHTLHQTLSRLNGLKIVQGFQQMQAWSSVASPKPHFSKPLSQHILKLIPLCLRPLNKAIVDELVAVTDNFSSLPLQVKTSLPITQSFIGSILEIHLTVDNSLQLRRSNFMLIENLHRLRITFEHRKTNRELKELFNVLPKAKCLQFEFDYRLHSHISSEGFPILAKSSEICQDQLDISLVNTRTEVFEDLMEFSRLVGNKNRLKLRITINQFIPVSEWPEQCRSVEWGTKVVRNIVKNVGNKVSTLELILPIKFALNQICETVINSDFTYLLNFTVKSEDNTEYKSCTIFKLLQKILYRKKLLLGLLKQAKAQPSNILARNPRLADSVYRVLF